MNEIGQVSIASRMANLSTGFCTEAVKQFSQRLQASNVLITPDAEVTGPDATISVDSHRFGKNQPRLT
ncbi:hypothetical protein D3C80_1940630 [compost metagenome]